MTIVAAPALELRCPSCRLLVLTFEPPAAPVSVRSRCRRCHVTFTALLRPDGAEATVRPDH